MQNNLRRAIWKAHNKKCFYCDESVSIRELQIDHFIPKSTDKDLKEEILKELNLDSNFDFNGLKNLVPSHTTCNNNRKGKYVPTAKSFSGVLVITEKLMSKILSIKEELDQEEKYDENISKIDTYIEKGHTSPEDLYNYFNKDESDFEEEERFEGNYVRVSTKNVMIQCFLPKFPELNGSMLITFRSLRIRDCMITFNHTEIVNEIFQGIGSLPEDNYRGFIVYNDVSENSTMIQLGNNRFTISLDEARQLCKLIDKIAPKYIDSIKSTESILKTRDYTYSRSGKFRILKISRLLWREILEFAAEHDYENGTTEWHIFDGRASYLKVYCATPEESIKDYRTFIYPELVDDYLWQDFSSSDNEVWLCWEPSILIDNEDDIEKLQNNIVWSAEYTYNWLTKCLIPTVTMYSRNKDKSVMRRFGQKEKFPSPFDNSKFIKSQTSPQLLSDFNNIKSLSKWVRKVQSFFAVHSKHYLSVHAIKGVFESILVCLKLCKIDIETLEYISGKISGNDSVESVITSVEEKVKELNNKKGVNGSNLEYALRPLIALLEEGDYKEQNEVMLINVLGSFLEVLQKEYIELLDLERARLLSK